MQVRIEGTVYDLSNNPIPGAIITLQESGIHRTSRKTGQYVFARVELQAGKTYTLTCDAEDYETAKQTIRVEEGRENSLNLDFHCEPAARGAEVSPNTLEANSPGSSFFLSNSISEAISNIATFMPTNSESVGGGGGVSGTFALQRVSKAVAQVLGRPLSPDPKSFLTALIAAFPEKEGQIVKKPVRAVVSLEVERGQLAAIQSTLYHEVQLIATDALKVLDGLRSISVDTDREEAEALKEMVRTEFSSLISEAGRVDRPRKSKADEILEELKSTGGHLDLLRAELGLTGSDTIENGENIVTLEEGQLVASMDLLVKYAITLERSFDDFFETEAGQDPSNGSFTGRLAFVSLLFSVVADSVRNLEAAMDAVDFSKAERRTTFIIDPVVSGTSQFRISIDGILSWIEDFALEEGPDLIAKSGRIGLSRAVAIVKNRLEPLVDELIEISGGPSSQAPHPGLTHHRVRNALRQLDNQLKEFYPEETSAKRLLRAGR